MPAYRYDALDAAGKNVNGLVEADNAKAARASLRGRGLVPMDVQPVAAASADGGGVRFTRRAWCSRPGRSWVACCTMARTGLRAGAPARRLRTGCQHSFAISVFGQGA